MYTSRKKKAYKKFAPGWMITFADMMALLLTFFIMMLSFSTTDSQKYKAVVNSMEAAFGPGSGKDIKNIVSKMESMTGNEKAGNEKQIPVTDFNSEKLKAENTAPFPLLGDQQNTKLNGFMEQAKAVLANELEQGAVQIEINNSNMLIRFPERVVFTSGSDELMNNFDSIIIKLKKVLTEIPGSITISGHTDSRPIDTFRFRSNWDLSSARAVSVLHAVLNNSGLDPARFTVQGHADTHPLTSGGSSYDQAENRRVEISIQNIAN